MTDFQPVPRRFNASWQSAWPIWMFLIFASLAVVHLLPAGFVRAAVAAPILLIVPGSLTLGAVVGERRRLQGVAFACCAVLLGAIWLALGSLILYVLGLSITADSTYWCLLAVSAALAAGAEARLLLGPSRGGHRTSHRRELLDADLSESEIQEVEDPPATRGAGSQALIAVAAGACLLGGGLYAYDRVPHPAPAGYTWIAWTHTPVNGYILVGASGLDLGFEIAQHQSDATTFRLSATWLSSPPHLLAKPVTLSIGRSEVFHGALFVPSLPSGCTYRIVVTLTATGPTGAPAKRPQSWSINADVHGSGTPSSKTCS